MRSEALALLRDGMNAHLDPEMLPEQKPETTVGRRRAAYYAAVAAGSDFRSRLDIVEAEQPAPVEPPAEIRRIGLAAG
jgi:RNA polymerase sigma factor for flagellar operon FliA